MNGNPFLTNPYFQGYKEQQPIQNIINTQIPQNDLFMAKFLKDGEQAESQFITTKTAFIDLIKNELTIRDMTGDIKKYQIIPPLDEKDIKINSLEKEIMELKEMIKNESYANIQSTNDSTEQITNDSKPSRTKSSAK